MNHVLVTKREDAVERIRRFQREIETLSPNLGYVVAWYACPDNKGGWLLGPSKFIGYKDLSAETYMNVYRDISGMRTEKALSPLSRPVPANSEQHEILFDQLSAMLAKYGKVPNTATRFRIIDTIAASSLENDSDLLELLIAVAKTLPAEQRKELIRRVS